MSEVQVRKISDFATKVGSGSTPKGGEANYKSAGVPLIRSMNVHFDGFRYDGLAFLDDDQASPLKNVEVCAGDVLLNITGASIGRVTDAPEKLQGARVNQHVCIIRPDHSVNSSYLRWYLASPVVQRQISSMESGATRQALTKEKILGFEVPVPDLQTQHEVVAEIEKQFSRLDEAVANLQRVKANLKRYKASVLKAAVEGRLVETEASIAQREGRSYETGEKLLQRILEERRTKWSGRGKYKQPDSPVLDGLDVLPEGWTYATTEQMCEQIASGSTPPPDAMFSGAGDVPFLKVYNLTFDGSLDFTVKPTYVAGTTHQGLLARSRSIPGDVLMNIVGPPLGKVSIVPSVFPEWNINQAIVTFRTSPGLVNRLLAHWLLAGPVLSRLERTAKATAGQHNLQVSTCRRLPIPIPPLAEQVRIVAELDRHLSSIHGVEAEVDTNLQRAQALRQATLAKTFDMNKPQQISAKIRESNQDA